MTQIMFQKFSGIFIIIVAIGFGVGQIGITKTFNYPQILRSPVSTILEKYYKGGTKLRLFWTCFALSTLMLIPTSAILYKIVNRNNTPYLIIGSAFGAAAGIFYVLGIMRWVLLADHLSQKYIDSHNNAATKETLGIVFEAFHIYCGNSIGETMGFLCMGIWIVINGISMIGSTLFHPAIGIGYIIAGIMIFLGPLEWMGFKLGNKLNKIGMKLLMLLLVVTGITLIV